MSKLHFLTLLFNFFCITLFCQNELIEYGSDWKYYDLGDKPPKTMGKEFERVGYNDSSWAIGPGQLGFGDGDEATILANPVDGNTLLTAYFRKEFTVADPDAFPGYFINLIYDDAAIVYLNGNEVRRINFSFFDFNPGYSTLANATGGDNAILSFEIDSSDLNTGINTIAVEVHQDNVNSTDLSFDLEIAPKPPIVRGPYLQKLTPSSVVVKWRTSTNLASTVMYGIAPNIFPDSVSSVTPVLDHELEVTGLASNQKYYYFIKNGIDTILPPSPDLYFITSPTHGTVQPVKAWILGDPGTANNDARTVRDAYYNYIGTDHTDMMLFLGDNAYNDGTDAQYQAAVFKSMYEDKLKNTVSWSCLGNHDGFTANSSTQSGPYYDIFTFPTNGEAGGIASGTEAYYSFDYANIHFIVLESYETDRSVGGAMFDWAQIDIQNTTQEWIVAMWHHPAYTKGSHDSDNEIELIEMRENFLPMLEENGVDLVLSGHSHSYERSYFVNGHYGNAATFDQNIHAVGPNGYGDGQIDGDGFYEKDLCTPGSVYITTGSAGKISNGSLDHPVFHYSASLLGSVVMEVDGDQMDIKFVRETGAVDDFFTIKKGTFNAACDDGDPCTINDIVDATCNCQGTPVTPMDSDNDGTDDCLDDCPNDPTKTDPGVCGCGISETADTDMDGTIDCSDGCINDPLKTEPGICGCGNSDTADADGDSVVDCLDDCPNDATKSDPGICGCGMSDTADADGDGTVDCIDDCPNDSNKTTTGICGCGNPDTDNDNNGICDGLGLDCNVIEENDFETNIGIWNVGGSDAAYINSTNSPDGSYSLKIQDNSGDASSVFTDPLDLTEVSSLQLDLTFRSVGFTSPQSFFLEFSGDGGSTYAIVKEWVAGTGFADNVITIENITINEVLTSTSVIKFRCNGNINSDQVYIDNVKLRDGAIDCNDLCPNDPNKSEPGVCGCGIADMDTDMDGVADCNDNCPNDINKTIPGICGCGVADTDTDLDNTADCNDGCPSDPNKTSAGVCGCGTADIDTDMDGTLDCNDACPVDPNKIAQGFCGCGIADTDTDMDSTLDCNDDCPNDPKKVVPGLCGCGNIDLDANNNGICDSEEDDCVTIDVENFEIDAGIWRVVNGGIDAQRVMSSFSPEGQYSMRIRDNSSAESSTFTNVLDLSQSGDLKVVFEFQSNGFEAPQSFFIEHSADGGLNYAVVNEWIYGTDFSNNVIYKDSIDIESAQLTSTSVIRFRSNGNINSDEIYLDNIHLKSCKEECVDYKIYSDNTNTTVSQSAIIGIETNRIIDGLIQVEHQAGEYILLTQGFEVKSQAVFHAFINGCK